MLIINRPYATSRLRKVNNFVMEGKARLTENAYIKLFAARKIDYLKRKDKH